MAVSFYLHSSQLQTLLNGIKLRRGTSCPVKSVCGQVFDSAFKRHTFHLPVDGGLFIWTSHFQPGRRFGSAYHHRQLHHRKPHSSSHRHFLSHYDRSGVDSTRMAGTSIVCVSTLHFRLTRRRIVNCFNYRQHFHYRLL